MSVTLTDEELALGRPGEVTTARWFHERAVERIVAARLAAVWQEGCDAGWAAAHDVVTRIDGSKDYAPRPTNPYPAVVAVGPADTTR